MSISRLYKKKRRHFMQIFFVFSLSLSHSLQVSMLHGLAQDLDARPTTHMLQMKCRVWSSLSYPVYKV